MKVSSFFNTITDLGDWIALFESVDTREQIVSRLERLKRRPDDILGLLLGSRETLNSAMNDTLEMNADIGEAEIGGDPDLDKELDALMDEKPIPEEIPSTENAKKDVEPSA
jgi:hypothetical protein